MALHFESLSFIHIKHHHKTEALWLKYLVWRCRNQKPDDSVWAGRYAEIRAVAATLVRHRKTTGEGNGYLDDYDVVLEELCRITALYRGSTKSRGRAIGRREAGQRWSFAPSENSNRRPKRNLLAAACYFGCVSLVKDLLAQGVITHKHFGIRTRP